MAAENVADLARALCFAAVAYRLPMAPDEAVFLAHLLEICGENASSVAEIDLAEVDPACPYTFLPVGQAEAGAIRRRGEPIPERLDHTAGRGSGPDAADALDPIDAAAVRTAATQVGVRGLWRAWRIPAEDIAWPPPKRVYLLEVASRRIRHLVTDRVARRLAATGETDPLVEVWAVDEDVADYQMMAVGGGALLWAADPAPASVRLAPVFDVNDSSTARDVVRDQPTLDDDDERQHVLEYLAAGETLLATDTLIEDVVDARGAVVPVDVRTDGAWIWTEATAYYLREHRLAPNADLLRHIRAAAYRPPQVGTVALFRAMAALDETAEA